MQKETKTINSTQCSNAEGKIIYCSGESDVADQ